MICKGQWFDPRIYHVPTPGEGGVAVKLGGALAKVLPRQCGGNTRGLLHIIKEGREMQNSRLRGKNSGFTNEQSPQDGAFSGDCWTRKSKSPLFFGDGAVITTISDTIYLALPALSPLLCLRAIFYLFLFLILSIFSMLATTQRHMSQ